jgi:adenine-specific DNA-methyltransferase
VGLAKINEANVRNDFVDPLFEALGWRVRDSNEYDLEKYIRGAGFADITIRLNSNPIIFVEAKRFGGVPSRSERGVQTTLAGLKVYADWTEEERQVLNYAGLTVEVKWAILTNFEKFRLFNAKTGEVVLSIESPGQYIERIDDIALLSKRNVENGLLEKLATRVERPDVDLTFLLLLNEWRLELAQNIHKNSPNLGLNDIKRYVQRILDRLVIIRYAEDRWILSNPDQLMAAFRYWQSTKTYTKLTEILKNLFTGFDKIHDSKIFERDDELDGVIDRIDSEVFADIIQSLYRQNFRKFSSDILGNTYESYLAHDLVKGPRGLQLVANSTVRKAGGIYFTPTYVVEYIVRASVDLLLDRMWGEVESLLSKHEYKAALEEFRKVEEIKIIDPACGSGSFLIKALDSVGRHYERFNEKIKDINEKLSQEAIELRRQGKNKEAWELEGLKDDVLVQHLDGYQKKILKDNIYGVDLDPQAAEITSVNLVLRALRKGERLPLILYSNVKSGDSVISADSKSMEKLFGADWKNKRPFDWPNEFPFKFDVAISNPPWIESKRMERPDKEFYASVYSSTTKQFDIFNAFVERGLALLKEHGILSYIVPNRFIMNPDYEPFRKFLLDNTRILEICDVGERIFAGVEMPACILTLEKNSNAKERDANMIRVKVDVKDLGKGEWREYSVPQIRFLREPMHIFTIYEPEEAANLIRKIERMGRPLRELVDNARGVEIGKSSKLIVSEAKDGQYVPFLAGEDMDRYVILGHRYLLLGDPTVDYKSPELYQGEKIIVRKTGTGIRATLDTKGYYVIQVIYIFKAKDPRVDPKYVLGVLNSKLVAFYYYSKFGEKEKQVFPHLRQETLLQVPIRLPDETRLEDREAKTNIVRSVEEIMKLTYEYRQLEVDFEGFLEPVVRFEDLSKYVNALESENRLFQNSVLKGKIHRVYAAQSDDWITISCDCTATNGREFKALPILKVRMKDYATRRFIFYTIRNYKKQLGSGNITKKILSMKIPRFHNQTEENTKAIKRIVEGYEKALGRKSKLATTISNLDSQIDSEVYRIYGLTKEEETLIRTSLGTDTLQS